ncbi:ANTAR domain-containing protein [Variovorax robiniae]|uniref:ANTAR domain-containing protein n=1 Tax=Variovorax robiniae TaxID=1836199 RepID=A0ABU8X0T2_9BURK
MLDLPEANALPEGLQRALAHCVTKVIFHRGADLRALDGACMDELLACATEMPGPGLLEALTALAGAAPSAPLSLLSPPMNEAMHASLVDVGIHAWGDVDKTEEFELAALQAQARARCRREAALRLELVQLRTQLDERKWVDRAKGLLMLGRGISEEEAFALLRRTSMHANLRLGEVSRSVVNAVQWAEAINRAGQLRMLSQRLARLAAQALAAVDTRSRGQRRQCAERVQDNLAFLAGLELGDEAAADLERTRAAWQSLSAAWTARITREAMAAIDAAAEALLASAEALTASLERASGRHALKIIGLCGRQRMLSERLAKEALLGQPGAPQMIATANEFESALLELENAPLTSPEIRELLANARDEWLRFARGVQGADTPQGRMMLVQSAEALVSTFDQLAARYEHSVQVIMS